MVSSSLGRRVASITQSSQSESPSCSPFGKKKKCKDKYLAKHSSSKCEQGNELHSQPWLFLWAGAGLSSMGGQPNGSAVLAVGPWEDTLHLSAFLNPFSKVLIPLRWPQLQHPPTPSPSSVVHKAGAASYRNQAPNYHILL